MDDEFRRALSALVPRLRRFALAMTGSAVDADYLVQRTCQRVLRRSERLGDNIRLDAWLYAIMRSIWTNELRGRDILRRSRVGQDHIGIGEPDRRITDQAPHLTKVRRVFAELPADQRTVLILVCVDSLSYQETADVLGIPISSVMSRLARARQDLHAGWSGQPTNDIETTKTIATALRQQD